MSPGRGPSSSERRAEPAVRAMQASRLAGLLASAGALARRPSLWPTAGRQLRRLAPRRWWTRPPFLPLPAPEYLRFRLLTQYGDAGHRPEPHDLLQYLVWCRDWNRSAR